MSTFDVSCHGGDIDVAEWVACSEHLERRRASQHNMTVVVQYVRQQHHVRHAQTLDSHNSAIRAATAGVTTPAGSTALAALGRAVAL